MFDMPGDPLVINCGVSLGGPIDLARATGALLGAGAARNWTCVAVRLHNRYHVPQTPP